MNSECIRAVETKAKWLKWSDELTVGRPDDHIPAGIKEAYKKCLQSNDLFFMNAKFCDLVDHARQSIPDDMKFDVTWFQAKYGWLWIDQPFEIPSVASISNRSIQNSEGLVLDSKELLKLSAIGWLPVNTVIETENGGRISSFDLRSPKTEGIAFLCYLDLGRIDTLARNLGYACWSYFTIKHGETLIEVIRKFEATAFPDMMDTYEPGRKMELLHEIRWIYTAFYLMAQRLSITYDQDVDRATRRRAEREQTSVPASIRVISLRRMEQAKQKAGGEQASIEWHWQWEVRGHWRNQYYRSTGDHRPVFVEAYIKGPEDKPLKPPGQKLFMAAR